MSKKHEKDFAYGIGVGFCLCIAGCAAVTFPYKYYGLSASDYNGTLLGPTQSDDVNLQVCAPTSTNAAPCTVMLTDAYLQLKEDYLDKVNQLNDCQKQLK
jgi:hypothetical protein